MNDETTFVVILRVALSCAGTRLPDDARAFTGKEGPEPSLYRHACLALRVPVWYAHAGH